MNPRKASIADIFTMVNALVGFLAITYVVDGLFGLASLLLFVAVLLDGLDGALARKFGTKHEFGRYLDFFADSVSFCFAPATLMYTVTYDVSRGSAWVSWENTLAVSVPTFYVCTGLIRLARFAEQGYQKPNFEGLPTPGAAFLVLAVFLLLDNMASEEFGSRIPLLAVMALAGSLMLTNLQYPKLRGGLTVLATAGILLMVAASILSLSSGQYADYTSLFALIGVALIAAYILLGPFYSSRKEKETKSRSMD